MEPASAFRDSAAVLFCSHFKIIDASLGNYDTPGFKLEQLLETRAAEAVATIGHGMMPTRSKQAGTGSFLLARSEGFTHQALRGES
jgi:hypothetical protein